MVNRTVIDELKQDAIAFKKSKLYRGLSALLIPLSMFVPYALAQNWIESANIWLMGLAMILAIIILIYDLKHPKAKAWHTRNWKKIMLSIISAFLIAVFTILIGLIFSHLMQSDNLSSQNQQLIVKEYKQNPLSLILLVSFIAPIFEETIYRRDIVRFTSKKAFWISSMITIIAFDLSHLMQTSLIALLPAFGQYLIPSIGLWAVYAKTKTIWCSMLTHCIYNFLTILSIMLVIG